MSTNRSRGEQQATGALAAHQPLPRREVNPPSRAYLRDGLGCVRADCRQTNPAAFLDSGFERMYHRGLSSNQTTEGGAMKRAVILARVSTEDQKGMACRNR